MSNNRIYYWDNFKALLILFVVIGHVMLPVYQSGKILSSLYIFIYTFHMPAFVFVSGFFAKRYMEKEVPQISKLMGFLVLYFISNLFLWVIKACMTHTFYIYHFFSVRSAPWYLLCMFLWYLILPFIAKIKPGYCIAVSIIISLVIGMEEGAGRFLSLSKFFVYSPFFIAGFYFDDKLRTYLTNRLYKVIAAIGLLASVVLIYVNLNFVKKYEHIIYASQSYSSMHFSDTEGILIRSIWYVIATVIIILVLTLIPQKQNLLSYLGSRTLAIFIFHRLICEVLRLSDFYKLFNGINELLTLIICLMISIALVFICSIKPLSKICNLPFKVSYKSIQR